MLVSVYSRLVGGEDRRSGDQDAVDGGLFPASLPSVEAWENKRSNSSPPPPHFVLCCLLHMGGGFAIRLAARRCPLTLLLRVQC